MGTFHRFRSGCRFLLVAAVVGVFGCTSTDRSSSPQVSGDSRHGAVEPIRNRASAVGSSPIEGGRRAAIREALRGLLFDSGRVTIDPSGVDDLPEGENADAETLELQAVACDARGDTVDAVRWRTLAVLVEPSVVRPYERMGAQLKQLQFTVEAAACFRSALNRDDSLIESRYQLGVCEQVLGDFGAARDSWAEVVRQNPSHGEGHVRLAVVLYYLTDYARAWEHVHAAEELEANMPPQLRALLSARMAEP